MSKRKSSMDSERIIHKRIILRAGIGERRILVHCGYYYLTDNRDDDMLFTVTGINQNAYYVGEHKEEINIKSSDVNKGRFTNAIIDRLRRKRKKRKRQRR